MSGYTACHDWQVTRKVKTEDDIYSPNNVTTFMIHATNACNPKMRDENLYEVNIFIDFGSKWVHYLFAEQYSENIERFTYNVFKNGITNGFGFDYYPPYLRRYENANVQITTYNDAMDYKTAKFMVTCTEECPIYVLVRTDSIIFVRADHELSYLDGKRVKFAFVTDKGFRLTRRVATIAVYNDKTMMSKSARKYI